MNRCRTEFREMLQHARGTHRHALRKAADLMERHNLTPQILVSMGPDEIERLLVDIGVKGAKALARRMAGAITHLAGKFPDAGLPVTPPVPSNQHELPHLRTLPRQFRLDLVTAWRARKRRLAQDQTDAELPITFWTYLRSSREFLAAAIRAGTETDDTFGVEELSYETVAKIAMDRVDADYSKATAKKIFDGMLAVMRYVLTERHPHVDWLDVQRSVESRQAGKSLSHASEIKLAEILSSGGVIRLRAVPDQIIASASAPGCARKDVVGRLQHALLLGIKLHHPALKEKQAVELHLYDDIKWVNGRRHLALWPLTKSARAVLEPMDDADVARLELLLSTRKRLDLESPLLYPTRQDSFNTPAGDDLAGGTADRKNRRRGSATLQTLYLEILTFAGLDVDFQDVKDIIVRVWLESGIPPYIVARRAGYQHLRSLETRMSAYFKAKGGS